LDHPYKGYRAVASLATIPKNAHYLASLGKGHRTVAYPYISYLLTARIWNFS
jgi:hypothetical protein